jgi:hypothetical protein
MGRIRIYLAAINDIEWLCMKIPLIYIWMIVLRDSLKDLHVIIEPKGICGLLDCSVVTGELGYWTILVFSVIFSIAYLCEFRMKWITLIVFLISIVVFSAEESGGILKRNGTLSFLFLAQSAAYWLYNVQRKKLRFSRMQFSIQAVTVGYFLSACSKLIDSGLSWPFDGQRIALQVLKSFHYKYYTNLDTEQLVKAIDFVEYLKGSENLIITVLMATLLLEFFALTAAINKTYARYYGFLLLLMHLGIYCFMDIFITSFAIPMAIVLINPMFLGLHLFINRPINFFIPLKRKIKK